MRVLLVHRHERQWLPLWGAFIQQGHTADLAATLAAAREKMLTQSHDAVIVDFSLCGIGSAAALELKAADARASLLAVIAPGVPEQALAAIESGFDDYVSQAADARELITRVAALAGRHGIGRASIKIEDLEIDRGKRKVRRAGRIIRLTRRKFALLECLALHAGHSMPRAVLAQRVWQLTSPPATNVVEVSINHLRRKIDEPFARKLIRTVRGVGYQLGGPTAHDARAFERHSSTSLPFGKRSP